MRIEVKEYIPPTLATARGAIIWRKKWEPKMPCFRNWRFVTLTTHHEGAAEDAYQHGKRQLRQFIYELKKIYYFERYCWKLEFHEDGFAHWHLLVEYKQKMDWETVSKCWRLGRVNVKRVQGESFAYLFKYISKSGDLPDWFLSYKSPRLFQTKNFAINGASSEKKASARPVEKSSDNTKKRSRVSLGERLALARRTVICITKTAEKSLYERYFLTNHETYGDYIVTVFTTFRKETKNNIIKLNKTTIETIEPWKHLLKQAA